MVKEKKLARIHMVLPESMMGRIEVYMDERRAASISHAVRLLLEDALDRYDDRKVGNEK